MQAQKKTNETVNGLDVGALRAVVDEVGKDAAKGAVEFRVNTRWKGGTRSETTVQGYKLGGTEVKRAFAIQADEPFELLGENTAPNPQELLMAALNACITVGYVAGASVNGVRLDRVEVETSGALDLRGFLGIDPRVPAGYESIRCTVRIAGDGTAEQFRAIHDNVMRTSPNFFNLSRPIRIDADLQVG